MPNPFFSARIPYELYNRALKHSESTGESKTEILVKALSNYLDFPIENKNKSVSKFISYEMFEELYQEMKNSKLEMQNLKLEIENIKANDNKNDITPDNKLEEKDKLKVEEVKADDNKPDITPDNKLEEKNSNQSEEALITKENNELKENNLFGQIVFHSSTTSEVAKHINLTRRQIERLMEKAIEKAKSLNFNIESGKLLKERIEVTHKEGIRINDKPYKLFYLGTSSKDKPIWDLIPDNNLNNKNDNNLQQTQLLNFDYKEELDTSDSSTREINKNNYDNKNDNTET